MSKPTIRIGGVPEHFNFPWRLAHSHLGFEPQSLDFKWEDYYGGTGFMREDLHAGKLDVAIMLTEGAVADINARSGLQIVGQYVSSPLHWGVHVHANHGPDVISELEGKPFAISRKGSGSHLMAYVYAKSKGWDARNLQFVEVGNLKGAQSALAAEEATTFLWEKFTTKPIVDSGEWRRIDICPTPWPSFVLVARRAVVAQYGTALTELIQQIQQYLKATAPADIISMIHEDLGLQKGDLSNWLAQTSWICAPEVSAEVLISTEKQLREVGQVANSMPPSAYISDITTLV